MLKKKNDSHIYYIVNVLNNMDYLNFLESLWKVGKDSNNENYEKGDIWANEIFNNENYINIKFSDNLRLIYIPISKLFKTNKYVGFENKEIFEKIFGNVDLKSTNIESPSSQIIFVFKG